MLPTRRAPATPRPGLRPRFLLDRLSGHAAWRSPAMTTGTRMAAFLGRRRQLDRMGLLYQQAGGRVFFNLPSLAYILRRRPAPADADEDGFEEFARPATIQRRPVVTWVARQPAPPSPVAADERTSATPTTPGTAAPAPPSAASQAPADAMAAPILARHALGWTSLLVNDAPVARSGATPAAGQPAPASRSSGQSSAPLEPPDLLASTRDDADLAPSISTALPDALYQPLSLILSRATNGEAERLRRAPDPESLMPARSRGERPSSVVARSLLTALPAEARPAETAASALSEASPDPGPTVSSQREDRQSAQRPSPTSGAWPLLLQPPPLTPTFARVTPAEPGDEAPSPLAAIAPAMAPPETLLISRAIEPGLGAENLQEQTSPALDLTLTPPVLPPAVSTAGMPAPLGTTPTGYQPADAPPAANLTWQPSYQAAASRPALQRVGARSTSAPARQPDPDEPPTPPGGGAGAGRPRQLTLSNPVAPLTVRPPFDTLSALQTASPAWRAPALPLPAGQVRAATTPPAGGMTITSAPASMLVRTTTPPTGAPSTLPGLAAASASGLTPPAAPDAPASPTTQALPPVMSPAPTTVETSPTGEAPLVQRVTTATARLARLMPSIARLAAENDQPASADASAWFPSPPLPLMVRRAPTGISGVTTGASATSLTPPVAAQPSTQIGGSVADASAERIHPTAPYPVIAQLIPPTLTLQRAAASITTVPETQAATATLFAPALPGDLTGWSGMRATSQAPIAMTGGAPTPATSQALVAMTGEPAGMEQARGAGNRMASSIMAPPGTVAGAPSLLGGQRALDALPLPILLRRALAAPGGAAALAGALAASGEAPLDLILMRAAGEQRPATSLARSPGDPSRPLGPAAAATSPSIGVTTGTAAFTSRAEARLSGLEATDASAWSELAPALIARQATVSRPGSATQPATWAPALATLGAAPSSATATVQATQSIGQRARAAAALPLILSPAHAPARGMSPTTVTSIPPRPAAAPAAATLATRLALGAAPVSAFNLPDLTLAEAPTATPLASRPPLTPVYVSARASDDEAMSSIAPAPAPRGSTMPHVGPALPSQRPALPVVTPGRLGSTPATPAPAVARAPRPGDQPLPLPALQPIAPAASAEQAPILGELQRLTGRGAALPLPVRAPFERIFNTSFSDVEIHTDSTATAATGAAGAAAMTYGRHILFAPGRYQPDQAEGSALLAHELTHVVQQRASPARMALKSLGTVAPPEASAVEQQAEHTEARVLDLHHRNAFPAQPLVLSRALADTASATSTTQTGDNYLGDGTPSGPALGTADSPALGRLTAVESPKTDVVPQETAGGIGPSEVENLANRVYELLKDRLTTERERRGRWF